VFVSTLPFSSADPAVLQADPQVRTIDVTATAGPQVALPVNAPGRYVRVQLPGTGRTLSLAEVQVIAG